jgi:hypothetical protein
MTALKNWLYQNQDRDRDRVMLMCFIKYLNLIIIGSMGLTLCQLRMRILFNFILPPTYLPVRNVCIGDWPVRVIIPIHLR